MTDISYEIDKALPGDPMDIGIVEKGRTLKWEFGEYVIIKKIFQYNNLTYTQYVINENPTSKYVKGNVSEILIKKKKRGKKSTFEIFGEPSDLVGKIFMTLLKKSK